LLRVRSSNYLDWDHIAEKIADVAQRQVRRAMRIVVEQQVLLLERWKDIHGPVD
jgi:hypothetical protein